MRRIDGRWVIDDYYEDRALEEIEAKGLKPGDPVGELVDPRAPKEIAELAGASDAMGGRGADRGERGAGLGMYRAGGPTTLFGSAGIGPFSEGPLSAPKKAFFVREGVTEQNFMLEAARRTRAADADWARGRKEALRACGGVFDANAERLEGVAEEERQRELMLEYPVGVYEPHSGVVLCTYHVYPAYFELIMTSAQIVQIHSRRVRAGRACLTSRTMVQAQTLSKLSDRYLAALRLVVTPGRWRGSTRRWSSQLMRSARHPFSRRSRKYNWVYLSLFACMILHLLCGCIRAGLH
jgi:hypothetical protein